MNSVNLTVNAMRMIRVRLTERVEYFEASARYYKLAIADLDVNITRMEGVIMEKTTLGSDAPEEQGPLDTIEEPAESVAEPVSEPQAEPAVEAEQGDAITA